MTPEPPSGLGRRARAGICGKSWRAEGRRRKMCVCVRLLRPGGGRQQASERAKQDDGQRLTTSCCSLAVTLTLSISCASQLPSSTTSRSDRHQSRLIRTEAATQAHLAPRSEPFPNTPWPTSTSWPQPSHSDSGPPPRHYRTLPASRTDPS